MTDNTLSIILPVHNAQETLALRVAGMLEILSELTSRFELLIVDDGSTDETPDVANQLTRQFPQVELVWQSDRDGTNTALRMGLERARGNIVFVHDKAGPLGRQDLRRIWTLRGPPSGKLIMAAEPPNTAPDQRPATIRSRDERPKAVLHPSVPI